MNKRTILLLHILLLAISLYVYFWSDRSALSIRGTTSMVSGPGEMITLIVDDQIVKVNEDGDIASTLDLGAMGITELVADLFVEPNGEMLIGLSDSQLIRRYSPDGKLLDTHARPPSERVSDESSMKFAKNPRTGVLYVADSSHHRIQIFGPDGQERRVITVHGTTRVGEDGPDEGVEEEDSTPPREINFRYPNGLTIDHDRLYVSDSHNHQIVAFDLDGNFQRTYQTVYPRSSEYQYPTQFSISNNTLYVVNRGPLYLKGDVVAILLEGGETKRFYPSKGKINPYCLLAREDDVLIADGNLKRILSFYPDGTYRGLFGNEALQSIYSNKLKQLAAYKVLRWLSLGGLLAVLGNLLVLKRKDRLQREHEGLPSAHQPVTVIQNMLGPPGSRRRAVLLALVPGFGYVAAGRILRAIILLPLLLLCVVSFVICLVLYLLNGVIYLWPAMATGIVAALAWTGIVLDGKKLSESAKPQPHTLDQRSVAMTLTVPIITVILGACVQLLREKFINHDNPELALAIQGFFQKVMIALHFIDQPSVVFSAMQPASFFLGWGGAAAGLFGALAWKFQQKRNRMILAAVVGFIIGMVSWVLTATFPGAMLGGAYYMPLSQGLLLSTAVYLYFRRASGTMSIIPAGIIGAWIGEIIHLFLRFPLPFVTLPGASIRTTMIVYQAYFIHLAILIAINVMEKRRERQPLPPGSG